MEKLIQKKRRVLYRRRFVFVLTALITLAAVPAGTGCKQSVKGGSSGTQKDGSSSGGGQTQSEKPSELTLTIRGDERISISAPAFITVKPDQTWATVKMQIASKVTLKSGQDQAEYGIYEWRLNDEDGAVLTDGYVFTQNETVYALTSCTNAKWKTEGSKLIGYAGKKPRGKIIIPAEINGITITEIGEGAFKDCIGITEVDISACTRLTAIGHSAFYGCTLLREVKLPASLREIKGALGKGAFENCTRLRKVYWPENLQTLGPYAFCGCINLQGTLRLPANLTVLYTGAFYKCSRITEVNLSDCTQLKKIDIMVFRECSGLKRISFPAGIESIGSSAFYDCEKAELFDLSQCPNVRPDEHAFTGCSSARFKVKRGSKIKDTLLNSCYIDSGRKRKIALWQIEEVD